MATTKRRMRDFQRCLRSIQSFSDSQASITEWDETSLDWFSVQLRPKDGYYSGGKFDFKITFEGSYPKCPPRVDCLTEVFHPNIDTTSADYNVCLNLFDEWTATNNLEDVVQGLLFLMYNPNLEDPLSPYFDPSADEEDFEKSVRQSLEGLQVDSVMEETFTENQSAEAFDKDELNNDMEQILEKTMDIKVVDDMEDAEEKNPEDPDEDVPQTEDNSLTSVTQDVETENAANIAASARPTDEPTLPISRQESKVDKLDAGILNLDQEGSRDSETDNQNNLAMYIPRTFIPPQPDFLVSVVMTCVHLATR